MDIIISLSDEILCHILSFLSTKEAALTCPLSKRWRNLFASLMLLWFLRMLLFQLSSLYPLIILVSIIIKVVVHFKPLISACSILEELVMDDAGSLDVEHHKWYLTLSCATLQRLTFNCICLFHPCLTQSITFDTPRLAYLEYDSYVPKDYPVVHFDSLLKAKISLIPSVDNTIHSSPTNLIKGLRSVEILDLSPLKTSKIIYSCKEAIPVFKKLHHLSITTESNNCWRILPVLLKNSPNLETLVIKGPLHYDENGEEPEYVSECLSGHSCLWSCPVKVLKIILNKETILELDQLKHFLEKLPCLELVKICSCVTNQQEQLQLTQDLQNLPRSPKCKIQFDFITP